MTDLDKEIQELRRKNESLESENQKLRHMHYLDTAEIAYQRRVIDLLMEEEKE